MSDVEVHGDLIDHDLVEILALLVGPRRQFPFRDHRLDEHRRVGVALAVVLRVQRSKPRRYFTLEYRFEFEDGNAAKLLLEILLVDRRLEFLEVKYRHRGLKFPA